MSFARKKLSFKLLSVFIPLICFALAGLNLQAQTKKTPPKLKPSAATVISKNAKTSPAGSADKKTAGKIIVGKTIIGKTTIGKTTVGKTIGKEKTQQKVLKVSDKAPKISKAELARQAALEEAAERQQAAREREVQQHEAAMREAEEAHRQAALQEKLRREQAAREARARQLAFERGLKTETLLNISRDQTDGEDLEVRRAAVSALAGHAGTVVVLEPQTGKVLSMVNQDWAIRKGFKPCSTIKLITGVAGLTEKVIDAGGNIRSTRFPMALNDALAFSNNSYFQRVGTDLGNNRMLIYARDLGLGEPTGINAPGEVAGKLPYGNNNARIYSHGDDFEVTPLQLAVVVSTIANGGKMIVPQIPRTGVQKTNFQGATRRRVDLPLDKLQGVLPGMVGSVSYGTARRSGAAEFGAAGKTGSCTGQGSWLGLFASIAPVVNPRLAIVVVTRGAGERGKYASAIAGKIYRALGSRLKDKTGQELIAKVPLLLKPQPKVDAKTSALMDESQGEDSEDNDTNVLGRGATSAIDSATAKRANPKKGGDDASETARVTNKFTTVKSPVKSTATTAAKSSPLFAPIIIRVKGELSRPRVVPMTNK